MKRPERKPSPIWVGPRINPLGPLPEDKPTLAVVPEHLRDIAFHYIEQGKLLPNDTEVRLVQELWAWYLDNEPADWVHQKICGHEVLRLLRVQKSESAESSPS